MEESQIDRFEKMAEADPENELGHFSLGKAYLDAKRYGDAIPCFQRVTQLNPQHSRAYHLLAVAQKEAGDKTEAVSTLRIGLGIAGARGDLMPQKDMAALMQQLGARPPHIEEEPAGPMANPVATGEQIMCRRCGQMRSKMTERPFKGPLGDDVWAHICYTCWQEWIPIGTKVINELRLDFAQPTHAEMYDQHMKEFLNLD